MNFPTKGLVFYLDPAHSTTGFDVANGTVDIVEKGPNRLAGIAQPLNPVTPWQNSPSGFSHYLVGHDGSTVNYIDMDFHPQTDQTKDFGAIFFNGISSACYPAFINVNEGIGTLMLWVWISSECTNNTFLIGSGANVFIAAKVNSAGTHWSIPSSYMPMQLRNQGDSGEYSVDKWHCITVKVEKLTPSQIWSGGVNTYHTENYVHTLLVDNEVDSFVKTTTNTVSGNINHFISFNNTLPNGGFRGMWGSVAVWDRALTRKEMTLLYNQGQAKYTKHAIWGDNGGGIP